jgi:F420-dependent oxidoreductase-like protein
VRLSLFVDPQEGMSYRQLVDAAARAERDGYHGLYRSDHLTSTAGRHERAATEAWTTLAGLARETSRIRLGTLVTGMTHRHPSVLAAQALTVDHLSGGRLELAVGAAWNGDEHRSLGIEFPPAAERMDRLEEGIEVLKLLLTTDDAELDGRHYSLRAATMHPRPIQVPRPPLWVGGTGRRRLLPIAGAHADVWHGWADSAEELRELNVILDRAAESAGRDPSDVARASSLDLSQPLDAVGRDIEMFADGGVSYLTVGWPSEGRDVLDRFVDRFLS